MFANPNKLEESFDDGVPLKTDESSETNQLRDLLLPSIFDISVHTNKESETTFLELHNFPRDTYISYARTLDLHTPFNYVANGDFGTIKFTLPIPSDKMTDIQVENLSENFGELLHHVLCIDRFLVDKNKEVLNENKIILKRISERLKKRDSDKCSKVYAVAYSIRF